MYYFWSAAALCKHKTLSLRYYVPQYFSRSTLSLTLFELNEEVKIKRPKGATLINPSCTSIASFPNFFWPNIALQSVLPIYWVRIETKVGQLLKNFLELATSLSHTDYKYTMTKLFHSFVFAINLRILVNYYEYLNTVQVRKLLQVLFLVYDLEYH